jgi:hypothetical protein
VGKSWAVLSGRETHNETIRRLKGMLYGQDEAWLPRAPCAVRRAEGRLVVLDSGGGGIHFPTPAGLMIVEAHQALARSQGEGIECHALRLSEKQEAF